MRRVAKLLVLILIVALVAVFLPVWKGGRPLLALSDLKSWLESPVERDFPMPDLGGREPAVFYKWRDDAGQVHYSTEPPGPGVAYEQVEVDPDVNTLPAVPVPSSETSE